ncbi:hypothetical protein [Roseateles sp.]|uniref:hypothetical protein n=1 Tax=Roseateles sp. TaxID=1971397 RepID=UPI0031CF97AD
MTSDDLAFGNAPRRGRGAIVLAVVALHVLLAFWLQSSWHRGTPHHDAQHRSTMRMITIQLPPLTKDSAPRAEPRGAALAKASPGTFGRTRPRENEAVTPLPRVAATPSITADRTVVPDEAPPTEPRSTLVLPTPQQTSQSQIATSPAPSASGPTGRDLMYGAATQRALRQGTQGQPLLAERMDQASQAPERVEASAKLGKEIMKGATTDCLKGEFAGAGMGLLSAPFLLLAEARGKCRR